MNTTRQHAVVLGASIAGLAAARALSDYFERVTIVERDAIVDHSGERRGVPQGRHTHALLTRGKRALEELFPGVTEELVAAGAVVGTPADCTLVFSGVRMPKVDAGLDVVNASRVLLERTLVGRVARLDNVVIADRCDVHGLVASDDGERVTGVRLLRRADDSAEEVLSTDLVVDATGRGSRTPVWFKQLGYRAPEERTVEVAVAYTTAYYPRFPEDTEQQILAAPRPPGRRIGVAIAVEDDRYQVTLAGLEGEQAPTDREGYLDYARSLERPEVHELIRDREPLSEAVFMRYPANRRRHYERLERLPEGLIVCGDALCSFNPIYAQGMSVAAVEALALSRCLDDADTGLVRRFYDAITPMVDLAWSMATANDAKRGATGSPAPLPQRLIGQYLDRLTQRAGVDPTVAAAFLRVVTLVAPPQSLLHPRLAARVALGRLVAGPRSAPDGAYTPRHGAGKAPTAGHGEREPGVTSR